MTSSGQAVRLASTALLLALTACATAPAPAVLHGAGLGSTWTVKLGERSPVNLATIQLGIQASVDDVAHQMSRWETTSSLNGINGSASNDWQPVPEGLFKPLTYALSLAADTGGAYDPTVAALVDVLGFGKAGRRYEPPDAEAIAVARERVGYAKVSLDESALRIRKPAGMQIDLSSMTHGRGADRVSEYLNSIGVHSYLVDVGSEIRARGESPEGGAWHVAIERPPAEDAATSHAFAHLVQLRDAGIATSGDFRYYFDYNGRRYSHRIDPRTGEAVANALASVTVIDPVCMHADALATALTVLGPDEGLKYATDRDIAALFIVRSGDALVEKMTPRFAAYLN
jgi:thiamine biosynthesis lipoprotein